MRKPLSNWRIKLMVIFNKIHLVPSRIKCYDCNMFIFTECLADHELTHALQAKGSVV